MAAEFKIGRLRYTWAGTWAPGTVYSRDDVVLDDGKAYTCLIPNTSSTNFYTDLYATFPVWQQITDGKTWSGSWVTAHSYGVGHIVVFGGKVYYSSVAHTSTTFLADSANWTEYTEFDGWNPTWTINKAYGVNDVVRWGGIVYKCIANHQSAGSTSAGLEANQASWTVYYSGVEYKGVWASGTRYKLNDLVKVDGNIYRCSTYNSDSSFTPAKWTMWIPGQMFDLVWSSGTTYQIGDTVVYGGDAYISKTANNSANDPSTSTANWGLFNVGYAVRNSWNSGSSYAPGDLVARNGVLYEAVADSTNQDPNTSTISKFYIPGGSSGTTLNVNSAAGIIPGMIVGGEGISNGQTVSTITTTTASATAASITGTPITISSFTSSTANGPYLVTLAIPDQGTPPTASSFTVSGNSNTNYNALATVTTITATSVTLSYASDPGSYGTGTTILTNGSTVITVSSFTTKAPSSYSVVFAIPSQATAPSITTTYVVAGNSNTAFNGTFSATASSTTSITLTYLASPGSYGTGTTTATPTNGNVLTLGGTVTGTFAAGMVLEDNGAISAYIVSGSGTSWIISTNRTLVSGAITGTLNSIKLTTSPNSTLTSGQTLSFKGINGTYWSLLIPGKKWTNRWTTATQYAVGDVVSWANGTYSCINNHLSAYVSPVSNNRPDYDFTSTNWILLISHDLNNALNIPGDLRTFSNGKPQALPIGVHTYVLGVSADVPNWRKINVIPAVYYVDAFSGIDSTEYGLTWDQPWATIKYACDTVNQGFYYPNAVALLKANKAYVIAEMYQWMLYQMAQNLSPFTVDSLWDPLRAQRDAEQIIDAVIYDMKRGGNSQSVAATLSFFYYGTKDRLINSLVESSIVYYPPALTYLQTVIASVISNTVITSYQTLNAVPAVSVVNQVISNSISAEIGAFVELQSLMSIVITALTNKNTYLVPGSNTGITASIYVKTGTYSELLPIIVPENTAIIGDELRSAVVQPAISKTLYCTQTISTTNNPATSNHMIVNSTIGLTDQMPLQFISPYVNNAPTAFGGVISGKTYYVVGASITDTSLQIKDAPTFNFTGSTTIGSNKLSNVTSITNLKVGMNIVGPGIPDNTVVSEFSQAVNSIATITLSTVVYDNITQVYSYAPSNATSSGILQTFTASGNLVNFENGYGNMMIYAGDCLKDMFLMHNGTGVRNMSFFGLKGTVSAVNEYNTARPTGGAYTALDPGTGPNDTSVWIIRKSPYAQNITVFGDGATGIKIDGYLHNGGSKSIVSNDYTMVISDGIGIWCTGPAAITEAISVFSYYAYAGYFAEAGGRIRSANGNSSYGTFGVVSEGYDLTEVPVTGNINNQSQQVQASVTSAFGTTDQLLKLNYSNAGSGYYIPTTNMLKWSNEFLTTWTNDANLSYTKNSIAPTGFTEAWLLTGSTSTPGSGYIQQSVAINPAGYTYTAVGGTTQDGAPGTGATFDITVTSTAYVVTVNYSGGPAAQYQTGNTILIKGSVLGGMDTTNDLTIVVGNLSGSGVSSISSTSGVVPTGSNQAYTLSMYVYAGTSASIDLQAVFSGTTTVTSGISYNVSSHSVTPYSGTSITSSANGGTLPLQYGAEKTLATGWYRVWLSISDSTGVNNTLTYKFFPQGANAPVANTYTVIYGSQLEISDTDYTPNFYLETTTNRFTAYANYEVVGAGAGAVLTGDEMRSQAVFNSRITTDNNGYTGGAGYATSSNTAQDGNTYTIKLSSTDQGLYNYLGMRVFVGSGTGAGQYGFISYYNIGSGVDSNGISAKTALILKESVDPLTVITSIYDATPANNLLTLASGTDISTWYVNQAVQFIPTYYTTTATATSIDTVVATATVGGVINTIAIPTDSLEVNMPVTFTGSDFNITAGYLYYIVTIDRAADLIQISTELAGNPIELSTVASGSMTMTYPRYSGYIKAPTQNMVPNINISFTGVALGGVALGTNYYISDIIDSNNFTVSTNKVTLTTVETVGSPLGVVTNQIKATTTALVPMNPVVFTGTIFDAGITQGAVYYVSKIIDANNFTIADSIIRTTVTNTEFGTNLVTMTSVTNFVVGNPIIFSGIATGKTFGNIIPETVYYIQTINTLTKAITISADKTNTFTLTSRVGLIQARTCPSPVTLGGGTGSMTLTTTGTRLLVTHSVGNVSTMNGTFSTSLFSGVNSYTVYYITSLIPGSNPQLTISTTKAGTPISLSTGVGNMQMAASGWDNITPGTVVSPFLDSTSAYFIEPRPVFTSPSYSQVSGTVATPLVGGASFNRIAYGNNYFIAIPTSGSVGARSIDGATWTSVALPTSVQTWSDIAYGNYYWVAIGTGTGQTSVAAYSNSNGTGWRTVAMPSYSTWSRITYGNGTFVAISSDNTRAAYSTDQGKTWTATSLSSSTAITLTGTPVLSTAQSKFGLSSLSLDGSSYVTVASDDRFAYNKEDFTIECFIRLNSIGGTQTIIDQRTAGNEAAILIDVQATGAVRLYVLGTARITSATLVTANTWTHIAVSRASGVTRLFVNGTAQATTYTDANVYAARPVAIGVNAIANNAYTTGYIDEVRISRGVSRYSGSFTPTLSAFTSDANTMLLMHLDGTNNSTAITSTIGSWVSLAYGTGLFVAVNTNGQTTWSPDGITWNLSTAPTSSTTLSGVTISGGAGQISCTTTTTQLVAGQSVTITGVNSGDGSIVNGTYYISSAGLNGKNTFVLADTYAHAIGGTNPISTSAGTTTGLTFAVGSPNYTGIAFGNNKFVAIQSGTGLYSAYSFDGVNWGQSLTYMSATKIAYGQGTFVTVNSESTNAWVSEHGIYWTSRTLTYGSISAMKFGFNSNNIGVFATLTGDGSSSGNATAINEGAKPQGRVTVSSGVITAVSLWETGSNYTSVPTVNLIDYNVSVNATLTPRVGNGALANPTFINRGTGYSTTSTVVTITGNGYADTYQIGLNLIVKNLASVPLVGSNLSIDGNDQVYKVTNATAVFGTVAPFIEATIQVSPEMTTARSPGHNTAVQLRQLYSQCRVTNHDFLLVGTGNRATANYPYTDITTAKINQQAVETNQGHIFYSSTDENGNFSVGGLFGVQQATGTVTLSATQFGLTGLQTLSLGGIAVGSSSVVITQFSTDSTFAANSDAIVPTQRAVKSYLTGRLSQGGANTYTGNFIAGTISVGGPNVVKSTVANGAVGSGIKMQNKVYIIGKGVDGNMAALDMFIRSATKRGL